MSLLDSNPQSQSSIVSAAQNDAEAISNELINDMALGLKNSNKKGINLKLPFHFVLGAQMGGIVTIVVAFLKSCPAQVGLEFKRNLISVLEKELPDVQQTP